ncbi:MAG: hypothetical protein AAGD32_06665 [Planctomycetota bacterium]
MSDAIEQVDATRADPNRDRRGQFVPGNRAACGGGNPLLAASNRLRAKLAATLTDDDIDAAIQVLRDGMTDENKRVRMAAARELLDRSVGRPSSSLEFLAKFESDGVQPRFDMTRLNEEQQLHLREILALAAG